MPLLALPNELLLLIAQSFGPKDLSHLLSASRHLSILLTPRLHTLALDPADTLPSLHWSVIRNYPQLTAVLLANPKTAVDSCCPGGCTALHYASAEGHVQIVELLLAHGADPNITDVANETPLIVCAQYNSKVHLHHLRRFPTHLVSTDSHPTQHQHTWDSDSAHEEIIKFLTSRGANKDSVDCYGRTALHCAVLSGNVRIVKALLATGADPDIPNRDGDTPVMWATRNSAGSGSLEILRLLVETGRVDLGRGNGTGYTVLHYAAMDRNVDVVRFLLGLEGVKLDAVDRWGRTAMFHTLMVSSGGFEALMMLLEKGADYSVVDVEGDTALHFAARTRLVEASRALLEAGARADVRNLDGSTPFKEATIPTSCELSSLYFGWWYNRSSRLD